MGIFLNGRPLGTNNLASVSLRNNQIYRTSSYASGVAWGHPILLAGIDQLTITATTIHDCKFGYYVQHSTKVLIRDGQQRGTGDSAVAYDFTGSADVRVEKMRAPFGTELAVGGTAGTRVTHWEDDLVAPVAYGTNAAAVTAGVPKHAPYWTDSAVAVRL